MKRRFSLPTGVLAAAAVGALVAVSNQVPVNPALQKVRMDQHGTSAMAGMVMAAAPAFNPNLDPGESITVSPAQTGIAPHPGFQPAPDTYHHEFQANCSTNKEQADDPIVFPGMSGASHMHTFMGNTTTSAQTTTGSLYAGGTSCITPQDKSAYWFPTMYNGTTVIHPSGPQVIYYKSAVYDYTTVQPFPRGIRFVVGSPTSTQAEFQNHPGAVEGWECGNISKSWDFPANCDAGTQLNVRMQSPGCWDGVHLDSADHKSHMAYPVGNPNDYGHLICPSTHPVAIPMIEFKMAFPVSGNMSQVHLASGRGYSWHYDFFNAWEPTVLGALTRHCINGGLQCNPRGFDVYKPQRGGVLDENYRLLPNIS